MTSTAPPEADVSQQIKAKKRPGDLIFSGTALAAGVMILISLAAVAIFLIVQAIPGMGAEGRASILEVVEDGEPTPISFWEYVGPLAFGTVWAAVLALIMAVPLSICVALFISHFAPRRLAQGLGYLVDLLAAVPSVVFGLWGILVMAPAIQPVYSWIIDAFAGVAGWVHSVLPFLPSPDAFLTGEISWLNPFGGNVSGTGRTIFTAAIVLAVMVTPIITAMCREVFLQTPSLHEEAALALGATRWEMIRMAVLPFSRGGMVSGAMLGLGRALGETMAVAMVLSATGGVTFQLFTSTNPGTIPANIALAFPEAHGLNINVLIATGLILFIVTFAVNALARWIVDRRKEFSGAN